MPARQSRTLRHLLGLGLCIALAGAALAQQAGLPEVRLAIGEVSLVAEVASTPRQREIGLMYRAKMAPGRGMLFVFEREQSLSFWMKNTRIALDIAFIDAAGRIVDIQAMQPFDLTSHRSAAPARYALEVPQGWFARHGVTVGSRVDLPPL